MIDEELTKPLIDFYDEYKNRQDDLKEIDELKVELRKRWEKIVKLEEDKVKLRSGFQRLLDDLTDAGENKAEDSTEEYDSVFNARKILEEIK